jgi:acetylornithine deacetylase
MLPPSSGLQQQKNIVSGGGHPADILSAMDVVSITRRLVDIESISGNERAVGEFLLEYLSSLGYSAARMEVTPERFNVYATVPGHRSCPRPRTTTTFTDVAPATPRE